MCPVSVVHRNALWHYLNSSSCQTTVTRGRNASHGGSCLCSVILCIIIYGVVPVLGQEPAAVQLKTLMLL